MTKLPSRIRRLPFQRLELQRTGKIIVQQCYLAATFSSRFLGLMGVASLGESEGLLLAPCHDIHMGFMRFPIDAVFLKKVASKSAGQQHYQITSLRAGLHPWKLLPAIDPEADATLEVCSGFSLKHGLQQGDILLCSN